MEVCFTFNFGDRESRYLKVNSDWDIATLKAVIDFVTKIPRGQLRFIFKSVQLEEGFTLADYDIVDESVIHIQLNVLGSGKRGRKDVEEDEGGKKIEKIIGEITVKEGDADDVIKAIREEISVEKWLEEMPLDNTEALKLVCAKYEKAGHTDSVLRKYAEFVPSVSAVED